MIRSKLTWQGQTECALLRSALSLACQRRLSRRHQVRSTTQETSRRNPPRQSTQWATAATREARTCSKLRHQLLATLAQEGMFQKLVLIHPTSERCQGGRCRKPREARFRKRLTEIRPTTRDRAWASNSIQRTSRLEAATSARVAGLTPTSLDRSKTRTQVQ